MAKCTADDVMESIDTWTILDVHKLVKGLEEKYGITAAPAVVAGGAAPAAAGAAPAAEEKTSFAVVLQGAGQQKINVIKVVRELTGLGSERSERPRGSRPQEREGRALQGSRRRNEKEIGGCGRHCRSKVIFPPRNWAMQAVGVRGVGCI
jgi:large subunit ribosomal protein L7/L12